MAILERVDAEQMSRAFARMLDAEAERHGSPPPRLGVEQEYYVRRGDRRIDFRSLAPRLAALGVAVHPTDAEVHLTPAGIALLPDYDVAETASPPVHIGPECGRAIEAWAASGAHLLQSTLDRGDALEGASTHISVETSTELNDQLCLAYATTYAPGLMLLLDRADSPGLLVRPRPGRTELCGEFSVGAQLRAAVAYAAGSVLAAAHDLRAGRWRGPRPLVVTVEPARRRYGWYVSREAFGSDLYATGRKTTLRRQHGGGVSAQQYLEWGWARARRELSKYVDEEDLTDADESVAGRAPLPTEHALTEWSTGLVAPSPAPIGLATLQRVRCDIEVQLHTATWDVAVFQIRCRNERAVAVVPQRLLSGFLDLFDRGDLDSVFISYLATRSDDVPRVVTRASQTEGPGLHDDILRSTDLLPADRMGVGPGPVDPIRPGKRVVPPPGRIEEPPPPAVGTPPTDEGPSRGIPWIPLAIAIVVVLLVGLITVITRAGDETTNTATVASSASPASTESVPSESSAPPPAAVPPPNTVLDSCFQLDVQPGATTFIPTFLTAPMVPGEYDVTLTTGSGEKSGTATVPPGGRFAAVPIGFTQFTTINDIAITGPNGAIDRGTFASQLPFVLDAAHDHPTDCDGANLEVPPPAGAGDVTAEVSTFLDTLANNTHTVSGVDQMVATLDAAVIDRYGAEQCRTFLSRTTDPTAAFKVVSVGSPAPFDYTSDGQTTTVPNVIPVVVQHTRNGQTQQETIHLARNPDGSLAWFTRCAG